MRLFMGRGNMRLFMGRENMRFFMRKGNMRLQESQTAKRKTRENGGRGTAPGGRTRDKAGARAGK